MHYALNPYAHATDKIKKEGSNATTVTPNKTKSMTPKKHALKNPYKKNKGILKDSQVVNKESRTVTFKKSTMKSKKSPKEKKGLLFLR